MLLSAYSIFKRPDLIDKVEPFLEVGFRIPGAGHYTPNLAQEINLSRIQRQLIADKGSFDGGNPKPAVHKRLDRIDVTPDGHLEGLQESVGDKSVGSFPEGTSPATIFRAALPERQINVDRVSIRVMWRAVYATKLTFYGLARAIVRVPLSIVIHRFESCHDSNADSYSRCFRYLDCFNGGVSVDQLESPTDSAHLYQTRVTFKAVYLSSQLDRKTDCFRNTGAVVWGSSAWHRRPSTFWRGAEQVREILLPVFTKAVCGTQTKQGGCLYEQPNSQELLCQDVANVTKILNMNVLRVQTILKAMTFIVLNALQIYMNNLNGFLKSKRLKKKPNWQKPGIGIAAVSPVPKRDIRKGEGTDYPYQ